MAPFTKAAFPLQHGNTPAHVLGDGRFNFFASFGNDHHTDIFFNAVNNKVNRFGGDQVC